MMMGDTATGISKATVSARPPQSLRRARISAAPMPITVFTGTAINATSAESFKAARALGLVTSLQNAEKPWLNASMKR